MLHDLECGSEKWGRYTCKDAPRPSVCCANGCCATSPYEVDLSTGLPLWGCVLVSISAASAMLLIFAACIYRDSRALNAYNLLKETQEEERRRQQLRSEGLHQPHPTPAT
ncbi:hypothetical protein JKF63_01536 [Porcisia hertigi]|uniref:Uncharacterized protein n=1 Tax=Porcisia hertigi TaxID=2761500 RepID=A0A836I9I3_9TRYP|nr:hypothetical protein JKF63_01536 [Porcisia hertigi]